MVQFGTILTKSGEVYRGCAIFDVNDQEIEVMYTAEYDPREYAFARIKRQNIKQII